MKNRLAQIIIASILIFCHAGAGAQIDITRVISGGIKAVEALTLTDQQMASYVKESVAYMDSHNQVAPENNEYTVRLKRLTSDLKQADGLPLNFKVYLVKDVNAFACPDGSVRVFSSLMDIMDDDELLGVIGHEIGHVAKHHSKNAYKHALLASAAQDAVASTNSTLAALTDSQLGQLSEALLTANYSRKQETEADEYGYEFLKSHGINPLAMAKSFKKFQQLESKSPQSNSYLQKMFSSHPDTKKRIKNIEKRAKKEGYTYKSMGQNPGTAAGASNTKGTTTPQDNTQMSATEKWLKEHAK